MSLIESVATLYVSRLRGWFGRADGIPILMYHRVTEAQERSTGFHPTTTTSSVFAEHLRFLSEAHYSTVGLDDVVRRVDDPAAKMQNIVALTFDDGYEDCYTGVFPLLARYGFSATVFLPTLYVAATPRYFRGARCLTWPQVRELRRHGIDFGSHTETHRRLDALPENEIEAELWQSKDAIEQALGEAVTSFAYPYAFPAHKRGFVQALREILQAAGYENGVSTVIGLANHQTDRLFMSRLPMSSADDLGLFQIKIEGGYDWVRPIQYAYKAARQVVSGGQWRMPGRISGSDRQHPSHVRSNDVA